MKNWKRVSDNSIRHVWYCTAKDCGCGHTECTIDPNWYQNNGTPMCPEGEDMEYSHTEVDDRSEIEGEFAVLLIDDAL